MKQKIKEWSKRYLPAEVLSITVTVISSSLTFNFTESQITTALVGTWAGNISFFGYILISDIVKSVNKAHLSGLPYSWVSFLKNIRALALEFGVAEFIDSLFIRPALMYYIPLWIGNLSLGVIVAKLAADITFYIPAIVSYEVSKRYMKNSNESTGLSQYSSTSLPSGSSRYKASDTP